MPIEASTPTVIEQGATFDKLWATQIRIEADHPRRPVRASFEIRKSRVRPDGTHQFSPVDPPQRITLGDLFADAATRAAAGKPALAVAMNAVLAAVAELAAEQAED
jgi:hypothetical protein